MALVSHLDLMRLFDRVIRRAGLPITFTGGFHPSPRIAIASALALGATSDGEIVDFELSQPMALDIFRTQITQAIPEDIPIYDVKEIDLKAPAANQVIEAADYLITVHTLAEATATQWEEWIDTIKAKEELWWEKTSKSGKRTLVNLRSRLWEIELRHSSININECESTVLINYTGICRYDGVILRPEQILTMLEMVSTEKFQLLHIHRNRLLLAL